MEKKKKKGGKEIRGTIRDRPKSRFGGAMGGDGLAGGGQALRKNSAVRTYRNSYLIHVGELQRIIVDVVLGEGRGLRGWRARRVRRGRRFLGITVPLVKV